MASIRQNVQMWQGDSFTIRIALTDAAGDPLELGGGATARWWAGATVAATGSDIYVQKTTADGGVTIETASGQSTLIVSIAPADTVTVPAGNHYHEAEVIDGATVSTVTTGRFSLIDALIPPAAVIVLIFADTIIQTTDMIG